MSGREGHDAMAQQREYVMQLLGSVTGTLEEAPAINTVNDSLDKISQISDGTASGDYSNNDCAGDTEKVDRKRDLECNDPQWESRKGCKRLCSSESENIANGESKDVHQTNSSTIVLNTPPDNNTDNLNVDSVNTWDESSESSDSEDSDSVGTPSPSINPQTLDSSLDDKDLQSSTPVLEGEKHTETLHQQGNDTMTSDTLNGSAASETVPICDREIKRKNPRVSEGIDDLIKRAKEFSSQRVPITGSMFTNVVHENTDENYSIDSHAVKDQVQSRREVTNNSITAMTPITPNKRSRLSSSEYNRRVQSHCVSSTPNSASMNRSSIHNVTNSMSAAKSQEKRVQDSTEFNLSNPLLLMDYHRHFRGTNNYTKGCKWSPDGRLLLTMSADQHFRLFELPAPLASHTLPGDDDALELPTESRAPALTLPEGELVYDYLWYPLMTQGDPSSQTFVCCCRALPVHMWDANSGDLVCSYRPFNHLDELAPTSSLGFSRDGCKLVCGFNKCIRIFQTNRPGRQCSTVCGKRQNGIISCFDFHPGLHSVFAAGSYLGSVGLYSTNTNKLFSLLEGHSGGITQLTFSSDGYRLYTGARKDSELLCWDIRQMGHVLSSHCRTVDTHQRVAFALSSDDATLITGSTDGVVSSWRAAGDGSSADAPLPATQRFTAHDDCANGVSLHPQYPVLATSSGQRRRPPHPDDTKDAQGDQDELTIPRQSTVRLWWLGA